MAFITHSDISQWLTADCDTQEVAGLLGDIESDLKADYNMRFGDDEDTTLELRVGQVNNQAIFDYWFIKSITSLKIKEYGSTSEEVLILGTDYLLSEIDNEECSGVYYRISLLNRNHNRGGRQISDHCYLELVGSVGFLETVPVRLQRAIARYINARLKAGQLGLTGAEGVLKRAKTGDSEVEFDTSKIEGVPDSISQYQDFLDVIKHYLP